MSHNNAWKQLHQLLGMMVNSELILLLVDAT